MKALKIIQYFYCCLVKRAKNYAIEISDLETELLGAPLLNQ